jgi:propionyl-CoA carboxylase alpha chain
VNYDSAGTVEFVAARSKLLPGNEHACNSASVTELITGIDLVEQMIRSAAGEAR